MRIVIKILIITLLLGAVNSCSSTKTVESDIAPSESSKFSRDPISISYEPDVSIDPSDVIFRAFKNGKSGWMNVSGEWIIDPIYDIDFSRKWNEGILICKKEGKFGAINYKGDIVLPFIYGNPSKDCSYGLIRVSKNNRWAYFSKNGIKKTKFMTYLPSFRGGLAVISENLEPVPKFYSSSDGNVRAKCNLIVINTNFDTLLNFHQIPFEIQFGELTNNRRLFSIYPILYKHADGGASKGKYGYLDKFGNLTIDATINSSGRWLTVFGGQYKPWDFSFCNNLAKVREGDLYSYIDTLGNKLFSLNSKDTKVTSLTNFNNCGIAGFMSRDSSENRSKLNLITTTGDIVYESYNATVSLHCGNLSTNVAFFNHYIPISECKNKHEKRIYDSCFNLITELPLKDSVSGYNYRYYPIDDNHTMVQYLSKNYYEQKFLSKKRIIDKNLKPLSSWLPPYSSLFVNYGNYSITDSTNTKSVLYDFDNNELYSCDSCFISKSPGYGLNKFFLSNKQFDYVNFKGKVVSEFFDDLDEDSFDYLKVQIKTYDDSDIQTLNITESEVEEIFARSKMEDKEY